MSTIQTSSPLAAIGIGRGTIIMVGAIALSTFGLANAGTAAAGAPAVSFEDPAGPRFNRYS